MGHCDGLVIREAGLADLDVVTDFEMGVIRYNAQFGAAIIRPATEALVRAETQAALATRPAWAWLAERDGRPVGLVHVQPPERSGWIAGMTRPGVTVYLQTMFVRPGERGSGVGAALVRHVHGVLDGRGVQPTLLHYALMNPLSAPFWNRMGYRPLWTGCGGAPSGFAALSTEEGSPRVVVRGGRGRRMIVDGCAGMLRVRSWLPQKTAD